MFSGYPKFFFWEFQLMELKTHHDSCINYEKFAENPWVYWNSTGITKYVKMMVIYLFIGLVLDSRAILCVSIFSDIYHFKNASLKLRFSYSGRKEGKGRNPNEKSA